MSDGRPQDPGLNRSGTTPLTPDSLDSELEARDQPTDVSGNPGPVPEENRPGSPSGEPQDRPEEPPHTENESGEPQNG